MSNLLILTRDAASQREFYDGLSRRGLDCSPVSDIDSVPEILNEREPDIVLFEIARRWPDEEARGLIKRIKRERNLPVIALVSEDALENFKDGPDFDDFIIGPFNPAEALLRIDRVLQKQKKTASDDVIEHNGLQLDLASCEVSVDNRIVDLTFKEYELLKLLASNRGRVFTRDDLLNKIWGYDYFGGDRTVDVHIRRLRSKIEDANHSYIETVRNIGYKFIKNN
jgi:DNA-binding response OmpR family regulator